MGYSNQLLGILVLVLVLLEGWWCHACWEHERNALLQLKASFNYPNGDGGVLPSWDKVSDCCNWDKVRCDATTGHVTQLDLSSTKNWLREEYYTSYTSLSWHLNASLFLPFQKLKILDLSFNKIVGCVENEGCERLAGLKNLVFLDLSNNNLSESILPSLGGLSSLRSLNLSVNALRGTINVQELNKLTNLKELDMRHNGISGFTSFHGDEWRMNNLETLDLSYNKLNNSFLSTIRGLASLKFLFISNNHLRGSLNITELSALRNLEVLDLSLNPVRNFVAAPEDIGHPINLRVIYLDEVISDGGSILLSSLTAFPNLKALYLRWNNLYGTVFAQERNNLSSVEELFLDGSFWDEDFFQSIGMLPSLKILSLPGLGNTSSIQVWPNLENLEHLNLSSNINVSQTFFPTIGTMTSLKVLSLSRCGFTGTLPESGGLCGLKHLQELDISYNDLTGSLPMCLANLTSLQLLDLSYNRFVGNISLSPLIALKSLTELVLTGNHFQIPISLGAFFNHSKLKYLNAKQNELFAETEVQNSTPKFQFRTLFLSGHGDIGAFPRFLYHQYDLKSVELSQIGMQGEFPYWLLDNNTKLEVLHLANNSLSGTLQLPIHSHMHLSSIDMSDNRFHGQVPTEIGAFLPTLTFLNMSNNGFNGSIPSSFGNMKSLETLDLSNNRLSGGIPENLTIGCFSLRDLILSNNTLQGQIFSNGINLKYLEWLQLDGNNFTGTIPSSLSNCYYLATLDVSDNYLSGKIPQWIGNMLSLRVLDLSKNNLSGRVPISMTNVLLLEVLNLSENNLSGSLPSSFHLPKLKEVYFSKNKLRGTLGDAFCGCDQLMTLDVSHNFFTGSIPECIGVLYQLSYLLLSHNSFEGDIPIQVCDLDQLTLIDLSHNILSGPIHPCLRCSSNWYRQQEATWFPSTEPAAQAPGPAPASSVIVPSPIYKLKQPLEFTTKSISYSYQGSILTYISGIDLSSNNFTGHVPPEFGDLNQIEVLNLSHNSLTGPIPPTFSNLDQIESLDLSYNNLDGIIPPELTNLNFLEVFSVAHNNLSGMTPKRVGQFGTFDNSSYEGNPFLCGLPLSKSCTDPIPPSNPSSMPGTSTENEDDNGFINVGVFYASFLVSYFMMLFAIAAVLYINPYWRRRWFYFIETKTTSCYYCFVDHCPRLSKFIVW